MTDPFAQLDTLSTAPVLLVASDFDGTLAPIVSDPTRAFPQRETMVALKSLAAMRNTHVALISGRALRDLAMLTGSPDSVHLVGSHGSEFDPGFSQSLPPEAIELLERVTLELEEIADNAPGAIVERKPASVAFHYRNVEPDRIPDLVDAVLEGPAQRAGVYVRTGKMVVELSVLATDKGAALQSIRSRAGATVAIYLGDDETDEDAFATLCGPDVGIKVGEGKSRASFRLGDTYSVARFLAALAERRGAWLAGSQAVPIVEHSLVSDQRTVALLTGDARITWLCTPRIDSPAIFGELLGGPTAGYFSVAAADGARAVEQTYDTDSLILRTRWDDFEVVDYLDASGGRPLQRAGRTDLVRVIEGRGKVRLEFAPRLEFGRPATHLKVREEGLEVEDSPDPIVLWSPGISWSVHTEGMHMTATAEVKLGKEPVVLELRAGTHSLAAPLVAETERRRQSARFWADWAQQLRVPDGPHRDLIVRSALVLKSLVHGPTGSIAAAATTSLPENLGGVRNWDYRYCWLRDAALSAQALVRLGSITEAMRLLDWLLGVLDRSPAPEQLRPIYTVTGEELGIEAEISELSGYAGSRPVRIGNSAARQLQLDVFGPIVHLVDLLLDAGAPISTEHWRLVTSIIAAVGKRWQEPDHGIWEIRGPRRHFVHSKTMCWHAVDRALAIGRRFTGQEREDWRALRDRIRTDVLEHGWKEQVGSFVAAYDGTDPDAATLQIGLCGMVEPQDPRFTRTIDTVARYLQEGATVYRYRYDDHLPGTEGGFHLCTSWLIDSLIIAGRLAEARNLFDRLIALGGPTGLFSEEHDPRSGRSLGNHPQAYTHLGIIMNAVHLAAAAAEESAGKTRKKRKSRAANTPVPAATRKKGKRARASKDGDADFEGGSRRASG